MFANQGLTGLQVWVTEFGFPRDPLYQQDWDPAYDGIDAADGFYKQKQYYDVAIPALMGSPALVDHLFVTLRDPPLAGTGFLSEGVTDQSGYLAAHPGFETVTKYADQYH